MKTTESSVRECNQTSSRVGRLSNLIGTCKHTATLRSNRPVSPLFRVQKQAGEPHTPKNSWTSALPTQTNPMKILITVDGIEVEGTVLHRTQRDIVVEITRPYQGLQDKSHIPYFMTDHDFRGPFGDERAQTLLEDLYLCGRFLHPNLGALRKKWAEIQEKHRVGSNIYTREDFLRDRNEVRSQLRAGQVTQKEYDRALQKFKLQESKYGEAKDEAEAEFFNLHWPENVPNHALGILELLSTPSHDSP